MKIGQTKAKSNYKNYIAINGVIANLEDLQALKTRIKNGLEVIKQAAQTINTNNQCILNLETN